eukprot:scaffold106600_cov27-Phaeocystis_antarctica.AAC.1
MDQVGTFHCPLSWGTPRRRLAQCQRARREGRRRRQPVQRESSAPHGDTLVPGPRRHEDTLEACLARHAAVEHLS